MKSRGVYETPGGAILYKAHEVLETITLDRDTSHYKKLVAQQFGELVYFGKWFTPSLGFRIAYSGGEGYGATNVDTEFVNTNNVAILPDYLSKNYLSEHPEYKGDGTDYKGLYWQKFHMWNIHADFMLNLMNLCGGYKERVYNLIPYFGIGYARYEQGPWVLGEKYTDARGITYTIAEAPLKAQIDQYTGDNAKDEELYPMLKVQAQGICPYGWHVANSADWLDLFYAMAQASKTGTHTYPVAEADCNYQKLIGASKQGYGIPNVNGWLRNTKYWGDQYIDEGADEFGFDYFPLGVRYMTQGFQWWSMRAQSWVPMPFAGSTTNASGGRINVVIKNNASMVNTLENLDIGQAVCPFRCVKNYK